MKIGEWDSLGRARALLQRQLGELGAAEFAAHVSLHSDTKRQRILVATDIGLLDYTWAPMSPASDATWLLRGLLYRWRNVHGLRLQTDAQIDPDGGEPRSVWRLVGEDPKIELVADTGAERGAVVPLLAFARACLQHAE